MMQEGSNEPFDFFLHNHSFKSCKLENINIVSVINYQCVSTKYVEVISEAVKIKQLAQLQRLSIFTSLDGINLASGNHVKKTQCNFC